MPATRTVKTGWGRGRKAKFVGFAEGDGGLLAQHVGKSTRAAKGTKCLSAPTRELVFRCSFAKNLETLAGGVALIFRRSEVESHPCRLT
jgi:hypothetical protein